MELSKAYIMRRKISFIIIILKKEREMRALVLSATIFILSVLMIANEEQASFAVSLFSEFEDIEGGPR